MEDTKQTAATFGMLYNSRTGEPVRPATEDEREISRRARGNYGGRGDFRVRESLFGLTILGFVK